MKKNKLTKNLNKGLFVLFTLLVVVCISFSVSYSNFIFNSNNHRAVEMIVNKLNYKIKINGIETNNFTIAPGNTYLKIELASLNEIDTFYKLLYKNNPSLKIYNIDSPCNGSISISEKKYINLFVSNTSNENINGSFYVSGGYITNTIEDVEVIDDFKEIKDSINIGDYINYVPNGVYELNKYTVSSKYSGYENNQDVYLLSSKYRILNINEDGTIDIITDKSININSSNDKLFLIGSHGFNNGVYLLNDICNTLYGSSKYALNARNLNISDIENKLDLNVWNYKNTINEFVSTGLYGGYKNYNNIKYPSVLNNNEESLLTTGTSTGDITLAQSYWSKELISNNFEKPIYYEILLNSESSWLSSRFNNIMSDNVSFGIYSMTSTIVSGASLYDSLNDIYSNMKSIRPVITLNSDIKLNNRDNIWNIE